MEDLLEDVLRVLVGMEISRSFLSKVAMSGVKGLEGGPSVSHRENDAISTIPQRPASESVIPCSRGNRLEPVRMYMSFCGFPSSIHFKRWASICFLISSSNWGAFWISSMTKGQPYASRNRWGSVRARSLSERSSSVIIGQKSLNR